MGLTVPFLGGDGWDGLEGYATADQLKDSYFLSLIHISARTQKSPAAERTASGPEFWRKMQPKGAFSSFFARQTVLYLSLIHIFKPAKKAKEGADK